MSRVRRYPIGKLGSSGNDLVVRILSLRPGRLRRVQACLVLARLKHDRNRYEKGVAY